MKDDKLSWYKKTQMFVQAVGMFEQKIAFLIVPLTVIIERAYTDETHNYFQQELLRQGIRVDNINIRFIGLFDTVSSYGLFFDNDVKELSLNAVNKAYRTIHISAADEYRKNFALTNIKSTGFKGIALRLPGVHCDIGGAYNSVEYERSALYIMQISLANKMETSLAKDTNRFFEWLAEPNEITSFKDKLIDEGWVLPKQFKTEYSWWLNDDMQSIVLTGVLQKIINNTPLNYIKSVRDFNKKSLKESEIGLPPFGVLYGHRKIKNDYTFLPLEFMSDFAIETGVPIDKGYISTQRWVVPSALSAVHNGLKKYRDDVVNLRSELKKQDEAEIEERADRDGIFEEGVGKIKDRLTADKKKKYLKKSAQISYLDYISTKDLHYLRNNYLHWSAKSDKFGLDPVSRSVDFENTRKIYDDE